MADRFRIAEAVPRLRRLHAQVDTAAAVVARWRKIVDEARAVALRAAHDLL